MFAFFKRTYPAWVLPGLVVVASFLASSWSLFLPGIGAGHDLNHQARIYEMAQGLREGVFPVIWSQNLAYGYGMPLFEFYAPLPYYTGAFFHLIGFSLQTSTELLVAAATVATMVGVYGWGYSLTKDRTASLLGMVLLVLAPYRAVDLYVRAAISEAWAIACLPFLFWGMNRIAQKEKWGWILVSLSFAALLLSHNITALLSVPFIGMYALVSIGLQPAPWKEKLSRVAQTVGAGILGIGVGAWYAIPALAEKHFTQIDIFILDTYYLLSQHFLYIRQFFEPWGAWEYGGSGWGPNDEMSYFLGFSHIAVMFVAGVVGCWQVWKFYRLRKLDRSASLFLLLSGMTGVSLLLTLLKTQPIWEMLPSTEYIQFPWRMLSVTIVLASGMAMLALVHVPKRLQMSLFLGLTILTFGINWRYFQSEKYISHEGFYQDYGGYIRRETSNNLFDYLPLEIPFFHKQGFYLYKNPQYTEPEAPVTTLLFQREVLSSQPEILQDSTTKKVLHTRFAEPTLVTLNVAWYPGWEVVAFNQPLAVSASELGLVSFIAPAGETEITVRLTDTPVRFWSKILSLASVSVLVFVAWIFRFKTQKKKKKSA